MRPCPPPLVLLESRSPRGGGSSLAFSGWVGTVAAHRPEEVRPALAEVERAVATGRHAAGFLTYEAAPGLEPALRTRVCGSLPLVWFALFRERRVGRPDGPDGAGNYAVTPWEPSITRDRYGQAVTAIRSHLAAGDTYQVNYTFRLRAGFQGSDRAFYRDLCQSQRASRCAYLDLGRFRILSTSPEPFFSLKAGVVTVRPMKGTRPRGRWWAEDEEQATDLRGSEKDRAENVMIVDLLRNDLGRISQAGSVRVISLWEVERYETVLQMTSTVISRLRPGVGLTELLTALFPCGSVTGAPKVRTMQLIAGLEDSPREIYTGCIGFISPGGEAHFSVPIRTVWLDTLTERAEYGVGGGITYDSSLSGEYEECRVKARVLTHRRPQFDLLEILLWEPGCGYFLLERHLGRLQDSARYFGFPCDPGRVAAVLTAAARELGSATGRVCLMLTPQGRLRMESQVLKPPTRPWLRAALGPEPVDRREPLLYHQTTWRKEYERRLASRSGCDEVILQNQEGEVTELSQGNLVAVISGERWTPPVASGLLAGTFRDELLARGDIGVRVLKARDLAQAEELYRIDSVRRWMRLELVE